MGNIKLDVMAMAAHPDDIELGCSGTLMVQAELGWKIGIIDLTRGELGSRGTAETRKAEAAAANEIMDLDVRENIGLPDGFFENNKASQLELVKKIRKYRPEIVLANAPSDRHPDHGRASKLILDSCFLAGLRRIETELDGEKQTEWRPKQVFHYIQDTFIEPDFIVDISAVIERKKETIRCFKTQFMADQNEKIQTYISTPAFFEGLMSRSQLMGKRIGVAHGEGFIATKQLGVKSLGDLMI
ncbi:MAG TPA: bacillithiol biosynthesis deacetylase BshB1 [Chitinophagaceae bacterium]|nr:bacillithiol biosynthesis deacetylase BshB1 [Chitinophagaceae bacterium]